MAEYLTDLRTNISREPDGNVRISRRVHAPADAVWAVLANGWMYASWVVGASRIRAVEPQWPEQGSKVYHSFGIWPALIDDHTEVLTHESGRELLLKARGWPAGEAHVRIQVVPASTANSSVISIVEDVTSGAGRLIPRAIRQLVITPRNTEALRRLAFIAEGHTQNIDRQLSATTAWAQPRTS